MTETWLDFADEWILALESGEYEQGRHYLKHEGKFCCLGVLSSLLVEKGLGSWDTTSIRPDEPKTKCSESNPGIKIGEHIGYPSASAPFPAEFMPWALQSDLTDMNDGGKTFGEIAKVIRKEKEIVTQSIFD